MNKQYEDDEDDIINENLDEFDGDEEFDDMIDVDEYSGDYEGDYGANSFDNYSDDSRYD